MKRFSTLILKTLVCAGVCLSFSSYAAFTLEKEIKITDNALYFNGVKKRSVPAARNDADIGEKQYDYMYGAAISPHGDAIKVYKNFVFMTWYQGGKNNRHVMLTRYNLTTGKSKTIEFPHQHTGFEGRWWIGETHNTIAVGISPKNETIHLLYDMHAYHKGTKTDGNGSFEHDYFRYSYSIPGAASVADNDFTLGLFVKDTGKFSEGENDYKHVTMSGVEDHNAYSRLTYPQFFLNDQGDLFMQMRQGTSHDGKIQFIQYDGNTKWGEFKSFNTLEAKNHGAEKNWSIYGSMKYVDGKIRIAFQRRLHDKTDKFKYQDGIYYAYSNDASGQTDWYSPYDKKITLPIADAQEVLVAEPDNFVKTTKTNQVYIVGGFDWTVTDKGDVHIISQVKDLENNKTVNIHTYKKAGTNQYINSTDFAGASNIYTSGNDIYFIGLNESGRPFIEQGKGGTNNFTRVYNGSEGRQFDKGVVHIYQGKLYYYLLEKGQGDKRSTYLQIISLDN